MDVIILAGGLGTRLRSVVNDVPKCMAPVCGEPFLAYLFKYLSQYPIVENVILSVGYLKEMVKEWTDIYRERMPFVISYSEEVEPLGTGGAIKKALSIAKSEDALILNGDTFFDININEFYKKHKFVSTQLSMALKPMNKFDRYGNVSINEEHIITGFHEKIFCIRGLINGGVYLLKQRNEIMDHLFGKFSFEVDVLQQKIENLPIYGYVDDSYFIDIGIPEDYLKANIDFKTMF